MPEGTATWNGNYRIEIIRVIRLDPSSSRTSSEIQGIWTYLDNEWHHIQYVWIDIDI
jgi:hypothetical protein